MGTGRRVAGWGAASAVLAPLLLIMALCAGAAAARGAGADAEAASTAAFRAAYR